MPDTPQPALGARFQAIYDDMRAQDATVRQYERKIAAELDAINLAKQRISVALSAVRTQERWLKKQAAAQLRKEAGVKTIPGFQGPVETATDMRRRINEKFNSVTADALKKITPR
jgi:dsDNA-specific endonuclease/ATPase MutS2